MKLFDAKDGVNTYFHQDGDKTILRRTQDVQNALDMNARDRNADSGNWKGDFHKVASIPYIVIDQWRNELKAQGAHNPEPLARENHKWFIAKLNDYNYSKLRTKEGRI